MSSEEADPVIQVVGDDKQNVRPAVIGGERRKHPANHEQANAGQNASDPRVKREALHF
jgi:hypothetical protein